ncbi:MAG: YdeI/OmpD-associated family protein [Arachidicoccus sp.]|nr:YdeI/OmpD-associated family protein [Arachidicoccus sp.]
MSNQDLFEKLHYENEKNILIQGLPSSLEKQFLKIAFCKSITPLLKIRKIDFALIFAINHNQLCSILKDVFPALHSNTKVWIAYPKSTSKIVSDLNRNCSWEIFIKNSFQNQEEIELDSVWAAVSFKKANIGSEICPEKAAEFQPKTRAKSFDKKLSVIPDELDSLFIKNKKAREFFSSLPSSNQKEYVTWIQGAKRADTKQKRVESTLEKLLAGKMNPNEK